MNRSMSGDQAADYAKALTTCDTLEALRALVHEYQELALDAVPIVDAMTQADFEEWRRGLKIERRGKFAGEKFAKTFGAVLMPQPMMNIAMIADQYKAPFGVAWRRCRELRPDLLQLKSGQ